MFVLSAIATQLGSLGVPVSVTYWIAAHACAPTGLMRALSGFRKLQFIMVLTVNAALVIFVLEPRSPGGFLSVAF